MSCIEFNVSGLTTEEYNSESFCASMTDHLEVVMVSQTQDLQWRLENM